MSERTADSSAAPPVEDRRCAAWALENPLRRWLASPRATVDALRLERGHAVADLGAGVGYFADAILDRTAPDGHLLLVDPDAENLNRYRRRHGPDPRVDYLVGSAADLDAVPAASQDRVLLSLVLCCAVDKERILDQTWRILRPGGFALVTFPARGVGSRRRLAVSPPLWAALRRRRPWQEEPLHRWPIRWYRLTRPESAGK